MIDHLGAQFSRLLSQWHEMATTSYKILSKYTLLSIVDCLKVLCKSNMNIYIIHVQSCAA